MDIDSIRETLFQAMDDQYAADKEANETNYRLGQQKLMYNNDARGTLYSGQPTWERAQLAASNISNIAKTDANYLKQKLSIWDNITNTLDQINSYNKAAAALAKASKNVATSTSSGTSFLDLYNNLPKGDD
jgi:hypothetical protein